MTEQITPYNKRTTPFRLTNSTQNLVVPLGDGTGFVQFFRSAAKSATKSGKVDWARVNLSNLGKVFPDSGLLVALDHPTVSLLSTRSAVSSETFVSLCEQVGIDPGDRTGVRGLTFDEANAFLSSEGRVKDHPFDRDHHFKYEAVVPGSGSFSVGNVFLGIAKNNATDKVVYDDFNYDNITDDNIRVGSLAEMNTFGRRAQARVNRESPRQGSLKLVRRDPDILRQVDSLKEENEALRVRQAELEDRINSLSSNQ